MKEPLDALQKAIPSEALDKLMDEENGINVEVADEKHAAPAAIRISDFYAHMPDHRYIFAPTRDLWPASSVDSRMPPVTGPDGELLKPSKYLDRYAAVEQMVWSPGESMVIKDRLVDAGGWVRMNDVAIFNLYRPPTIKPGTASDVGPWLNHIHAIYPTEADHIIRWFAQRVQDPCVKINHALVLGGPQGIGKDTILEPLKVAVGPWNFHEVSPAALLGRFNGFVKSVVLRISEARDLGEMDRFTFYDHTKVYTAAPPDVLRCDEKNIREHSVLNVCGVIITTNHKSDGIYLPADDRRHFVAWSNRDRSEFTEDYWRKLWSWYGNGGTENVAAYLQELDLSDFNPKAPPPQTDAFWHIVNSGRSKEEAELMDVIESIGTPTATTMEHIVNAAHRKYPDLWDYLTDRKNRRKIPHRLEAVGYEPVRNGDAKDGLWKIAGKRQVIYARTELSTRERIRAAQEFAR